MKDLRAGVLNYLYEMFKRRGGNVWAVGNLDEDLGVPSGNAAMIIRDLVERGLVERGPKGGSRLTARGVEAIEEPGTEENGLVQSVQNITISGGNVQVGHSNTMNVTYSQVLTSLADQVERSPSASAEDKRSIVSKLRDLAKHPLVVGLALKAAELGVQHLPK